MILATLLSLCTPGPAVEQPTCTWDGDTIRLEGERIRIENIDTAELNGRCEEERTQALAARDRLRELLEEGFVVERTGRDRFRRTLARITVNGRDVGSQLIEEGHAQEWRGRREPWC